MLKQENRWLCTYDFEPGNILSYYVWKVKNLNCSVCSEPEHGTNTARFFHTLRCLFNVSIKIHTTYEIVFPFLFVPKIFIVSQPPISFTIQQILTDVKTTLFFLFQNNLSNQSIINNFIFFKIQFNKWSGKILSPKVITAPKSSDVTKVISAL